MNFDAFAIAVLLVLWSSLGVVPWLVLAAVRHGENALSALPLSVIGGLAGGLLVPALGFTDGRSLLVSLPFALLGGLLFTLAGIYLRRPRPTKLP